MKTAGVGLWAASSSRYLRTGSLLVGFDTVSIMRAGGWKSIAVLVRYLEKAEHNVWN